MFTLSALATIVTIQNVTIRYGNLASHAGDYDTQAGGGIYNFSTHLTISNCTFSNCILTGNPLYGHGGGLYNKSTHITVSNSTITGNSATGYGGGLYDYNSYNDDVSNLTNCTINGNSANKGGGIFYDNTKTSFIPELSNCTISGNSATEYGGGICNNRCNTIITNCTINGNSADAGGGICNYGKLGSSSPSITECTISGNSATGNGGGVYNVADGDALTSSPTLINCLISGNSANKGDGIYNSTALATGNPSFINCTISGNSATVSSGGGGMYNWVWSGTSNISLKNCIMWGDKANSSGNEIGNDGTSPTYYYSDIEGCGGSSSWDADFGTDGGNNIDSDPLFVTGVPSPAPDTGGDLHLQNGSPCLSTATSSGAPSDDLEGRSRPLGSGYDMGCYEEYDNGTLPVTLTAFNAQFIGNTPTLYWETQSETDNLGWNIYRNIQEDFPSSVKLTNEMIPGNGTSTEPSYYLYKDIENVEIEQTYYYWLESIDYSGILHVYNKIALITIPDPSTHPQNINAPIVYDFKSVPNPISVHSVFQFTLDKAALSSVSIYNVKGGFVRKLPAIITEPDVPASIFWNGKDEYGKEITAGVYFCTLIVNEKIEKIKKVILLQ